MSIDNISTSINVDDTIDGESRWLIPYKWESKLSSTCKSSLCPPKCEYGHPTICGRDAVFVFLAYAKGNKTNYPLDLYACREHVFAMKTGAEPRVIVYK